MMAIALGGRPEDNAKMVWSRGCIAYFFQQIGKGNAAPIPHLIPQDVASQHNLISLQLRSNFAAVSSSWIANPRNNIIISGN
ncbi:hypothetical protein FDV58_11190 [Bradyrhizobium elkanii]|uniref:Uncharacterized protein n=2 Tax=Nitrobacteraceae TaxID=41294 RepID=A0A4U6S1G3_BRAEL|nr:hypothetical protein [Bradyrhizobium sp. BR2003]TKV81447.1 hypothetical protein FDV58_11190 [Bradyrhizobium elkanii]